MAGGFSILGVVSCDFPFVLCDEFRILVLAVLVALGGYVLTKDVN